MDPAALSGAEVAEAGQPLSWLEGLLLIRDLGLSVLQCLDAVDLARLSMASCNLRVSPRCCVRRVSPDMEDLPDHRHAAKVSLLSWIPAELHICQTELGVCTASGGRVQHAVAAALQGVRRDQPAGLAGAQLP